MDRAEFDIWTAKEVARILTLVENETRYYQEILALVPVPLAVVSRQLRLTSVNRAFRRSFQLKHEEAGRRRLDEFIPAAVVKSHVEHAFETNLPDSGIEFTALDAAGVGRPYRLSVIPLPGLEADLEGEVLVVVEEPIHAAPPAARLLEELRVAVWLIDIESGDLQFANRGAARLLGREGVAAWINRVHPEDHARVAWVYEAALESGAEAAVEYRAIRAGGAIIWLADRIQPQSSGGRVRSLRIVTTGETERRIQHVQHVQEREVDAAMRLSRHVAHEFNNLWMILTGYTEMLADRIPESDSEALSAMDEIRKAVDRGVGATQQLLQFGRPSAGTMAVVDLNQLMRRIVPRASFQLTSLPVPVSADPVRLERAVRDLIESAAEGQPEGWRLEVETGRETRISDFGYGDWKGQFVTLRIGPLQGVSDKRMEHWCEPYFSDVEKATGIGLAPVDSQLRAMGIQVRLERRTGQAADFVLRFPLAPAPEPAVEPVPEPTFRRTEEPPPVAKLETVLVVDSEESILSLISRVLGRQGYEVITTATPEEALRIAAEPARRIHIIVTEIALPQLRGPQLVARLREIQPEMKVLYMSGFTDDPSLASGLQPPDAGFLQKPFTLNSLTSTVRAVLDSSRN
ncbi:MAG: response regulator [Bryobacterales bacterium]|nr:response regulator [Bryobacterales bacterium]